MTVRIALAQPRDLSAVAAIMGQAFDPRFGEAWSGTQLTGALAIPDTWVQVARAGDAPIGFSLARRILDEAELMLVAVLPERRGAGLGQALVRAAADAARSRGARTLFLEVREGNIAAQALYASMGFAAVGRRDHYYRGLSGERFDALTLRRSLIS